MAFAWLAVAAADALGGVGEALQVDAAAQL